MGGLPFCLNVFLSSWHILLFAVLFVGYLLPQRRRRRAGGWDRITRLFPPGTAAVTLVTSQPHWRAGLIGMPRNKQKETTYTYDDLISSSPRKMDKNRGSSEKASFVTPFRCIMDWSWQPLCQIVLRERKRAISNEEVE